MGVDTELESLHFASLKLRAIIVRFVVVGAFGRARYSSALHLPLEFSDIVLKEGAAQLAQAANGHIAV